MEEKHWHKVVQNIYNQTQLMLDLNKSSRKIRDVMTESVSDERQHRLGNGTINVQHPSFLYAVLFWHTQTDNDGDRQCGCGAHQRAAQRWGKRVLKGTTCQIDLSKQTSRVCTETAISQPTLNVSPGTSTNTHSASGRSLPIRSLQYIVTCTRIRARSNICCVYPAANLACE